MTTSGVGVMGLFEKMRTKRERGNNAIDVVLQVDEDFSGRRVFELTIAEIPIGFKGSWIGKDIVFEHFDSLAEFRAGTLVCDESSEIVVFEGNCGEGDTDRC